MNTQPEALRLADILDSYVMISMDGNKEKAAKELRRLHEVNKELVEALKVLSASVWNGESFDQVTEAALALAAEAINKAEGR